MRSNLFSLLQELGPGTVIVTGYDGDSLKKFEKQTQALEIIEMFGRKFQVAHICSQTVRADGAWHPGPVEYLVVLQQFFELEKAG